MPLKKPKAKKKVAGKFPCKKCSRRFATQRGLYQHDSKAHPCVPTPYVPPEPPETEHVSFIDLVRNDQWGKEYPKKGAKKPADNDLIIGLLALIEERLKETNRVLREGFRIR